MKTPQQLDDILNFQPYLLQPTGWTIYSTVWLQSLPQLKHPVFNKLQSSYDSPKTFIAEVTQLAFNYLSVLTLTLTQPPQSTHFFEYLGTKYPQISSQLPDIELHHILETEIPQFFFQPTSNHYTLWQQCQILSRFFQYWNEILDQQIHPVALQPIHTHNIFIDTLGSLIVLFRSQLKTQWELNNPNKKSK